MNVFVRWAPKEHYPWIAQRARIDTGPCFIALEAATEDGKGFAMVGFDGWTPRSLSMHVALGDSHAGKRAGRALIRPAFEFAFVEAKRSIVTGTVLSNNPKALALDMNLGFREVFRGKDWWGPGVDMIWLEMRREDCRWIEPQRKAA